ncbi:MAG: hypothetical protein O4861_21610 [Trichodesmium sp. St16_bin4-tuft]|nr:hypothetical protein [Trichodesmium sp. St4_bin8_1]MDE5073383.1 hypothetical protein [Trichodesmium sp. St5_bin8]MDE5091213.1 hypothetical protein [Trichodesmium sp. St18_bin3_1_1]MDE5100786.1 hypothetical protein [Trichodesmium sp. St16_bin4-tuft]MDE5104373.1 hypothetical protein [Trichodesmium sp. St19_bin2]
MSQDIKLVPYYQGYQRTTKSTKITIIKDNANVYIPYKEELDKVMNSNIVNDALKEEKELKKNQEKLRPKKLTKDIKLTSYYKGNQKAAKKMKNKEYVSIGIDDNNNTPKKHKAVNINQEQKEGKDNSGLVFESYKGTGTEKAKKRQRASFRQERANALI